MNITNNNFYKTIKVFVYFHNSTKNELNIFYKDALEALKIQKNNINKNYTNMTHADYEIKIYNIEKQIKKLETAGKERGKILCVCI